MDFETMMGPVMYQDIPSSFGFNAMPPTIYNGMYPIYGTGTIRPALQNDKFERIEQKHKESKHTFKKVMTILGGVALTALALKFGKKGFKKLFPNGFKAGMQNLWTTIKNGCANAWNSIKNFFKPSQQPTPPTP